MPAEALYARLARLMPLDRLSDEQRVILADRGEFRRFPAGKQVLAPASKDTAHYYLLEGKVRLRAPDGRETEVRSESEAARRAFSSRQLGIMELHCHTDSVFLVIEPAVISTLLREAPVSGGESHLAETETNPEYDVVMAFHEDLKNNRLKLPSLPDVALKIRQVSQRPNISLNDLARVIEEDPALTVKLVRAANSPFYRGFRAIETCADAVVRLGASATVDLITVYTLRDMFQSQNAALKTRLARLWRHVSEVGALACVLARMTPGLNPDKALLAGIVHDIGALPVIVFAEQHAERFQSEPDLLERMIEDLQAEIGSELLQSWAFPEEIVDAARHAEDWMYDTGSAQALCADAVILAQVHEGMKSGRPGMPPLEVLPAFRKMAGGQLTPGKSLEVLNNADEELNQLRGLLA